MGLLELEGDRTAPPTEWSSVAAVRDCKTFGKPGQRRPAEKPRHGSDSASVTAGLKNLEGPSPAAGLRWAGGRSAVRGKAWRRSRASVRRSFLNPTIGSSIRSCCDWLPQLPEKAHSDILSCLSHAVSPKPGKSCDRPRHSRRWLLHLRRDHRRRRTRRDSMGGPTTSRRPAAATNTPASAGTLPSWPVEFDLVVSQESFP